ncbi:MAG TPA: hypothetical protein VE998_06565, partial [Terriglobales bacterium]|nr:hypothetical protein [Terriglobales bacterium]
LRAPAAASAALDASRLQTPDGALLMNAGQLEVDPYFSMKALIVAQDAGLDIQAPAARFIAWLLPRQHSDGRFDRYCKKSGAWRACAAADADDSMLALWLQLLYRTVPKSGLSPEWLASIQRAQQHLTSLRNRRLGVYHVSHRNHVALFMDNVEVYWALKDVAAAQRRLGDPNAARTAADADSLARGIRYVFWNEKTQSFRASTQKEQPRFYPEVLAQTFAWMASLPLPEGDAPSAWSRWKQLYAKAWLSNRYDPHPWGLVALTAVKLGDDATAGCWLEHAAPARFGSQWNILEEAAYQAVQARVDETARAAGASCRRMEQGE